METRRLLDDATRREKQSARCKLQSMQMPMSNWRPLVSLLAFFCTQ